MSEGQGRTRRARLALAASLLAACASAPATPSAPGAQTLTAEADAGVSVPPPTFRLPTDVRPTAERISLRLDPRSATFTGMVRIQLSIGTPVQAFWLHAQDLSVRRASISQGGTERPARTTVASPDLLAVVPPAPLAPGQAELVLEYQGTIDAQRSRAIYAVVERDAAYLYTFFEPVDARRAFPCFDEPSFKIPWELEIAVPPGNGAFANTAEASRQTGPDGWLTIRFGRTRPLPSYLVAFAAGPFDVVAGAPAGHHQTPLRFIVPQGHREELAYMQASVPRMVQLLEDATEVPYPYGKLDVLIVPRYWGTMEHPGLVALGQTLMLFHPGVEALARQQWGSSIAIHELAHYWYGDLVTTAWWDDTWLNESFGSWMEAKVTDRLEPAWRWSRRALRARAMAMDADALPSAKPIRQPVRAREDITASFDDALTYEKGRTVISMFERWIGEPSWRGALTKYLTAYSDRNATSEDLFAALDSALGRNVSSALSSFVLQPGVPLVRGSLQCPAGRPAVLQLTQEPFSPTSGATDERTWRIPVCARAGSGKRVERACSVLESRRGALELPGSLGCPTWVLLDDGGLGYYRVAYAPGLRQKLLRAPSGSLSAEEQVSFASDLSALAERGEVPVAEVLDRAVVMTRSSDSDVVLSGWRMLDGWLRKDRLSRESLSRRIELFGALGSARARAIGWTARSGDSVDTRELRLGLLPLVAVGAQDRELQAGASRLARDWLEGRGGLEESILDPVLELAATHGDAELFDTMVNTALSRSQNDRTRIIDALGSFEDPALAARARALLDDPRFDLRDTGRILYRQLFRSETRPAAWPVLRDRAASLVPRMRDDEAKETIASIGWSCDRKIAEEARTSLGPLMEKLDGGPFAFQQALGQIERCAAIHDREAEAIRAWLSRRTRAVTARR